MTPPTIYRLPADVGIDATGLDGFGSLGDISAVTFHHSAGPRATNKAKAQALHRAYNAQHANQGWGGIGYHFSIDDLGRVYVLRPVRFKGAHTAGWNTGNVGFMVHGNYDRDKLTRAQKDTIKWLFQGGLFALTGEREKDIALARGHREWPNNPTACPGKYLMANLAYRRGRDFNP